MKTNLRYCIAVVPTFLVIVLLTIVRMLADGLSIVFRKLSFLFGRLDANSLSASRRVARIAADWVFKRD